MYSDRFEEWTDKSGGDQAEYYCRDVITGEVVSRSRRELINEWKAEQVKKSERKGAAA